MEGTLDISRIMGHSVTHISYGAGKIVSANDKQIQVLFTSGKMKKYQFPQAFVSYLQIDDESLMLEILEEEQIRKRKEEEEKAMLHSRLEETRHLTADPSIIKSRNQKSDRTSPRNMEESRNYDGLIIDGNTSFNTHADTLNMCFGYQYVHFQKAYKDLGNGYAVWFPRIAKRVGDQFLSSDNYWGWLNIISENGDTITQMDNPDYPYSGGEPDKNKRIIFARFEGDNKYLKLPTRLSNEKPYKQ